MSFLHEDKVISPDELKAGKPPDCPRCGNEMWLLVISKTASDGGTDGCFTYECKNCGAVAEINKPDIDA